MQAGMHVTQPGTSKFQQQSKEVFWCSKFSLQGLELAMPLGFSHSSLVWSCGPMPEHIKHGTGTVCTAESNLASLLHSTQPGTELTAYNKQLGGDGGWGKSS